MRKYPQIHDQLNEAVKYLEDNNSIKRAPDVRDAISKRILELRDQADSLAWFAARLPPLQEPIPQKVEHLLWSVIHSAHLPGYPSAMVQSAPTPFRGYGQFG